MKRFSWMVLVGCLGLMGCSTAPLIVEEPVRGPEVSVISQADLVHYEQIGEAECLNQRNESSCIEELKSKAALRGATAVLVKSKRTNVSCNFFGNDDRTCVSLRAGIYKGESESRQ